MKQSPTLSHWIAPLAVLAAIGYAIIKVFGG